MIHNYHEQAITPNCKNIVMGKNEKGKSQIGINYANEPYEFICSIRTWTSYLPVGICYCFKAEKQ